MTAGFSLNPAAQCRGVLPPSSRALRSAPASRSASMTAGFSLDSAALCRGVLPPSSRALGSAPDWRQSVISAAIAAPSTLSNSNPHNRLAPAPGPGPQAPRRRWQSFPRSCFLPIRSAHSLTSPEQDQQVALSISFPTKPPEHRGFAEAGRRSVELQSLPEAKLTEGVSTDDYSTWRAVRFADRDEIG